MKQSTRNAIIGILSALAIPATIGAWNMKENVSDHTADIQEIKASEATQHVRDSARYQTIIDLICEDKPSSRKCQ